MQSFCPPWPLKKGLRQSCQTSVHIRDPMDPVACLWNGLSVRGHLELLFQPLGLFLKRFDQSDPLRRYRAPGANGAVWVSLAAAVEAFGAIEKLRVIYAAANHAPADAEPNRQCASRRVNGAVASSCPVCDLSKESVQGRRQNAPVERFKVVEGSDAQPCRFRDCLANLLTVSRGRRLTYWTPLQPLLGHCCPWPLPPLRQISASVQPVALEPGRSGLEPMPDAKTRPYFPPLSPLGPQAQRMRQHRRMCDPQSSSERPHGRIHAVDEGQAIL
jgi:hypothetical protein